MIRRSTLVLATFGSDFALHLNTNITLICSFELVVTPSHLSMFSCWKTGMVNQRGGSEWEPIKILLKNSAYEPKITLRPPALLLPNPHSNWNATRPRSKTPPNHTQKHTAENNSSICCQSKTGQAGFSNHSDGSLGLKLSHTRWNRSGRFCPEIPQMTNKAKPKQTNSKHNKTWTSEATTSGGLACPKFLSKTHYWPNWTDFWNWSGQFCLGNQEELHPREKLDLHLKRSPNSLHRFKWDFGDSMGNLIGYLWPKAQAPKLTKSSGIESQPAKPPILELHWKTTKSKVFPRIWGGGGGKITKERGTTSSCVIPTTKPTKKLLRNLPTKIARKRLHR
jgi:hypothetical protein